MHHSDVGSTTSECCAGRALGPRGQGRGPGGGAEGTGPGSTTSECCGPGPGAWARSRRAAEGTRVLGSITSECCALAEPWGRGVRAPLVSAARAGPRAQGPGAAGAEADSRVAESADACSLRVTGARVQSREVLTGPASQWRWCGGGLCLPPMASGDGHACTPSLLRPHGASPPCVWVFAGLIGTLTAGLRSSPIQCALISTAAYIFRDPVSPV